MWHTTCRVQSAPDMPHMICTWLQRGHLSVLAGDSSWRIEEIVQKSRNAPFNEIIIIIITITTTIIIFYFYIIIIIIIIIIINVIIIIIINYASSFVAVPEVWMHWSRPFVRHGALSTDSGP